MTQKQCNKCGLIIEENGNFCPKCGSNDFGSLNLDESVTNEKDLQSGESFDSPIVVSNSESPKKKNKGLKTGLIVGGVVLLLVVVIIAIIFGGDKNNSNPQDNTQSSTTSTTEANYEKEMLNYIEKSKSFANSGDFIEALATLDTAEQLYGADARIDEQRKNVNIAKVLYEVTGYEAENDYASAIKAIQNSDVEVQNDAEVLQKLNLLKATYKNKIIKDADAALKSEGYAKAIAVINEGLQILCNDESLLNKISEYEEYKPVYLVDMDVFDYGSPYYWGGHSENNEYLQDINGKVYINSKSFLAEETWETFKLDGKYSRFHTIIAPPYDLHLYDYVSCIQIFADDKLIYTSSEFSKYSEPVEVELDITGVKYLKISCTMTKNAGGSASAGKMATLFEPYVAK